MDAINEMDRGAGGQLTTAELALTFVLAGRARVTLVSEKTGTRFTFRVSQPNGDGPHFVSLLRGDDNEGDFEFFGTIFEGRRFAHGRKARITADAPSAKAFAWAWGHLAAGRMPPGCQVWHEGRCGHCGRALTVPESIETGFGPVCMGRKAAA
jgi:hypothetical protein